MRIEFTWPYVEGKAAVIVACSIPTNLVVQADYRVGCSDKREEVLSIEVPGLSETLSGGLVTYSKLLCEIDVALQGLGIAAHVTIDGDSLWFYAADREYRAKELKAVCLEAAKMLKATRGWFKSERLAGIRRFLEPGSHP